jgi:hypothetical protein
MEQPTPHQRLLSFVVQHENCPGEIEVKSIDTEDGGCITVRCPGCGATHKEQSTVKPWNRVCSKWPGGLASREPLKTCDLITRTLRWDGNAGFSVHPTCRNHWLSNGSRPSGTNGNISPTRRACSEDVWPSFSKLDRFLEAG